MAQGTILVKTRVVQSRRLGIWQGTTSHRSNVKMNVAEFLKSNPDYGYGKASNSSKFLVKLDEIRAEEFARVPANCAYLDSVGSALYSERQIREASEDLCKEQCVLGNPHTLSRSSLRSSERVEQARDEILNFFGVTRDTHCVIFTPGATGACKIIGENFPWTSRSRLLYTVENHNSAVGIREYALKAGAAVSVARNVDRKPRGEQCSACKQRICDPLLHEEHLESLPAAASASQNGHAGSDTDSSAASLFIMPGECNFSGKKFDLAIANEIGRREGWMVFVDTASLVPIASLDLSEHECIDFMCLSFYKMFGYPTGIGALIARNDSLKVLRKTYFGGGTVKSVLYNAPIHALKDEPSARHEDGTVNFLSIALLRHGFNYLERLGGMQKIERHVWCLSRHLHRALSELKHENGAPVCRILGWEHASSLQQQGPVISLIMLRPNGDPVGYTEVEQLAVLHNIDIRTGCFCNPGSCAQLLDMTQESILNFIESGHVCGGAHDIVNGKPMGALRVSVGASTTLAEVEKFIRFTQTYFQSTSMTLGPRPQLPSASAAVTVTALWLYPIKSCAPHVVHGEWPFDERGLVFDRNWVVVDSAGKYINQKRAPELALVVPELDMKMGVLRLSAPQMETISVPIAIKAPSAQNKNVAVSVCGDRTSGAEILPVSAWFTKYLKKPCRLIQATGDTKRGKGSTHGNYANESAFLLVNEASVRSIQEQLPSAAPGVSARNFRPNIVVRSEDVGAFEEDHWATVQVAKDARLHVTGACNRCSMVCVNPDNGEVHKEPLATLAKVRRDERGRILFGVHLAAPGVSSERPGVLKVGQSLQFTSVSI